MTRTGARALARARCARDRRGVVGIERQRAQDIVAARGDLARRRAHDGQHRGPVQGDARRVVGAALKRGLKDAVEHARGVLGAREVAPEPEQFVGDPGEHLLLLLLLLADPRAGVAQVGHGRGVSIPSGSGAVGVLAALETKVSLEPPPRELTIIESRSARPRRPPGRS
jgi:hypothetical protein